MNDASYILAYDIGTTGCKTCLYSITDHIEIIDTAQAGYPLHMIPGGGAEQCVDDWWNAMCASTATILDRVKTDPSAIRGVSFCCQMQGFIAVDREGRALRNPMSYMDGRSTREISDYLHHGPIRIANMNARKLLKSLYITGGMAATAKDPLWKYHWMRRNEPELFTKMHKWLDVKEYLLLRCTGEFCMTPDSANITFLYDTRPGHLGWSKSMCRMFDVNIDHLPPIVQSTDPVGGLSEKAAAELGLKAGTPVFGGGGDVSSICIGAGCTNLYDTHIYVGTSGWVVSNVDKRMVDITCLIASILGVMPDRYNYVAEQETSGVCLQWVRDHLALDDIGVYLKTHGGDIEDPGSLYPLLNQVVEETPPGAGGVIFTPWLHGNRAPAEDPFARAMFFNVGLKTGKRMLIRAVLEGVAYHKRWMLESIEKKIPRRETVRFVGGGAKSDVWCQIMADVTGRTIETIDNPQDAGAVGAAVICGVGLGVIPSFGKARDFVPVRNTYIPRAEYRTIYDRGFGIFKKLYKNNKKLFWAMNRELQ